MNGCRAWSIIGAAVVAACNGSEGPGVEVTGASVRVAPVGATAAAAYATLRNRATVVDTLLGIRSEGGGDLSLHGYASDAGIGTMRDIGNVVLPAGATVRLAPGGMHAMLGTAGAAFEPGRSIRLTFRFAAAPSVSIAVPVTTITGEE